MKPSLAPGATLAKNDKVFAGADRAIVHGDAGNDTLTGGDGADRLFGGGGNDHLKAVDDERDLVDCGPGIDTAAAA